MLRGGALRPNRTVASHSELGIKNLSNLMLQRAPPRYRVLKVDSAAPYCAILSLLFFFFFDLGVANTCLPRTQKKTELG